MVRVVVLTVYADSEADRHLVALATKGEATTLQLKSEDGFGFYAAECIVTHAHTQVASDGRRCERVYKLRVIKRG